jgi:glycosyltransferase involved in cell wall biosynthesis
MLAHHIAESAYHPLLFATMSQAPDIDINPEGKQKHWPGCAATSPIRVAIVGSDLDYLVRFRLRLLAEIVSKGHEVHAIVPSGSEPQRAMLSRIGVRLTAIDMARNTIAPLSDMRCYRALCMTFASLRPNMVLAYTMKPIVYGLAAAASVGIPRRYALVTGLGRMFTSAGPAGRAKHAAASSLYRHALRSAEAVVFQNEDDRRMFLANRIVAPCSRTCVVNGSGVDVEAFEQMQVPSIPSFLMVARLIRQKGVSEYLQACRIVRRTLPAAKMVLAGYFDGKPDEGLRRELERAVSDGSVHFAGRVSDVRPLLRACSVFVLPSYREGLSRSILEAMSSGRAIITSDAPGCRETVRQHPQANGILVPVGSAERLAEAMTSIVSDQSRLASMGAQSRRFAESEFDVRLVNAQMLKVLKIGGEERNGTCGCS